jgi:hypothetical protein
VPVSLLALRDFFCAPVPYLLTLHFCRRKGLAARTVDFLRVGSFHLTYLNAISHRDMLPEKEMLRTLVNGWFVRHAIVQK